MNLKVLILPRAWYDENKIIFGIQILSQYVDCRLNSNIAPDKKTVYFI